MRKIKLMALLLATLMVVSAFAGCAGVKKEELDALDVRVQALEDLLNGQQKDLADIKDQIADLDNEEVLKAIESIKTDLEDKIKDVNDRVDDVDGKQDSVGTVISDEVKTAQQNALAKIEVQRATYTKNSYKYSEANFEKISEALGTATGAVNNATTVDGVNKALAAMDAELKKYLTYQDMAFKYYTDLLGNVNMDAEDLVNEALDFLKEVKAVYDKNVEVVGTIYADFDAQGNPDAEPYEGPIEGYRAELLYLVEEGTSDNRDKYIDMYKAVFTLCELYTGGASTEKSVYFVNAKGKVDFVDLKSVKGYQKEAKDLVERIALALGEELKYCGYTHTATDANHCGFIKVSKIYSDYEVYYENAGFLGGQKLLDLVTNAADIVEAEETVKLLKEAAEEFDKYIRVSAKGTADVFFYYDQLVENGAKHLLESNLDAKQITDPAGTVLVDASALGLKDRKNVWIADEYEKTDDALADWVAEFELSETNMLEIIRWKKGGYNYYGQDSTPSNTSYISNKLTNTLLVEAYNNFKTTLAEDIIEVNNMASVDVNMVKLYDEIEENYYKFFQLQSKPATLTTAKHPENLDIYIDGGNTAGLTTSPDTAAKNMWVILRDSGIFEEYAEERLEVLFENGANNKDGVISQYKSPRNITILDIYTFESDKRTLEFDRDPAINQIYFNAIDTDNNPATYLVVTDNRANGEIYNFFVTEYDNLKAAYKAINARIEALDETLVITNNRDYVLLEGKYVGLAAGTPAGASSLEIAGKTFTAAVDGNKYFPVEMVYNNEIMAPGVGPDGVANTDDDKDTYYDNYMKTLGASATIESFKYKYPDFVDLLDLAIFEADKAEKAKLLEDLFAEGLALVADLDAIPYVRLDTYGLTNTVYIFDDVNENGKFDFYDVNKNGVYDAGEEFDDINGNGTWEKDDEPGEAVTLATSTLVPYLVNLSNEEAVEALWNRLVAWRKLGGNHTLQKFANYVDVYGTSYDVVYVMEGFANAEKVKVEYAGNKIEELHKDIVELVALSTSFINATNAVKNVHNVNKFVATLSSTNGYTGNINATPSDWRNAYAWTSIESKTTNSNRAYEGVYKGYTSTNTSITIDTTNDDVTAPVDQVKTGSLPGGTAKNPLGTKAQVLNDTIVRYNNFEAANVMYVGDPANNYVTFEDLNSDGANDNVTLFYAQPEYVAYKPVEDAANGFKDLDLLSIKAKILAKFATTTTTLYSAHMLTFIQSIDKAKTAEEIEALVISHNAEMKKDGNLGDIVYIVPADYHLVSTVPGTVLVIEDVDADVFASIYDFESLAEQMLTLSLIEVNP